jgi:effector-binding domain-containing protein
MSALLSIGEFSRVTHLSVKALRHYDDVSLPVEYRTIPATRAIAIREQADWDGTEEWLVGALTELNGVLAPNAGVRNGADAALFSPEFFERHTGELVAYIPVASDVPVTGRAELIDVPAVDVAITLYRGPFSDIDQAYGALGTFIAERAIGDDGPIREHYLVTVADDPADLCTEVAWPVRSRPA